MEQTSTVLIVDDDATARKTLRAHLLSQGYHLEFAANGVEAINQAAALLPDVILLDVMMPELDGFEVCRRLRVDPLLAEVPIIMVTALDDRDSRLQAIEAGADDFVTKPYDRIELRARVKAITRLNRYRRLLTERSQRQQAEEMQQQLTREVAERTQAQQTLGAVLDAVGEGIITLDAKSNIVMVNQQVQQMWGFAQNELVGRNFETLLPKTYRANVKISPLDSARTGLSDLLGRWVELEGLRKDGSLFPLEIHITEARIGDQLLYTAAVRDITQRRELDKMRDDFVSTVSHELRTPLASIMGFIETVLNGRPGPLTDTQRRFLENSYKGSERLLKLIEELLTVSRIQQGTLKLDMHPFSPRQALHNIKEMMAPLAQAKSITLEISDNWPEPRQLFGDQDRLEQVIANFASNAIKFTPEGGRVSIDSRQTAEGWQLRVIDTGIGIPQDELPRLFQRFYRASNAIESQIQGTGLGLFVCRAIIEAHGGQIGIESKLSGGVLAWFTVPLADQNL